MRKKISIILLITMLTISGCQRELEYEGTPLSSEESSQEETSKVQSTFRFIINSVPTFSTPTGIGDLWITNHKDNEEDIVVEIRLADNLELLYESAKLSPGEQIIEDTLLVELPPGEHRAIATAYVYYEEETKTPAMEVEIIITIKEEEIV